MRHMPCFWTDSLPFPRYWPLGLSFLYFQDNSIEDISSHIFVLSNP
jgi:hypothetical protein